MATRTKTPKLPANVYSIAGTDLLYTTSGDERFSHQDASQLSQNLPKITGYAKWDLAEKREAVLLIDDNRYNPAVNTTEHPGVGPYWYWLKPVDASSAAGGAWGVYFGSGSVSGNYRYCHVRALAVCRPLPASQQ
jgi:hypothetical protein